MTRTGGQLLLDSLRIHGTDRIYSVPGESCLPFLEALRTEPKVDLVICRHEAGAAHMAEADGKMTGRPGVILVSRGPGAMHAAVGIHMAQQNSSPQIVIIGQVPREFRGREAFQEMNYTAIFADMTKWVTEITDARQIPEIVSRAFHVATHGRPGPVVLSIPEDVFDDLVDVPDLPAYKFVEPGVTPAAMAEVRRLLAKAKNPLLVVGGTGWTDQARGDITAFAEANDLPVVAAFRCQDVVDNRHPNYVGVLGFTVNPALRARFKDCDCLLVVGDRLGEQTTQGYTLIEAPVPKQPLIHVYPGAEELGRVFSAVLPIHAGVAAFAAAARQLDPVPSPAWSGARAAAREDFLRYQAPLNRNGEIDLSCIVGHIRAVLPDDAVVTNGAGNYAGWVARFFEFRDRGSQLAPQGGSMGYGFPAAIAAKLRHPERPVVAFAGDGCFLMASTEFATAVQRKLPVIVVIVNNGMYGAIRAHQERHYPGRHVGTDLHNPDFADFARSFGGFGVVVTKTKDFAAAFDQALASKLPAIIELRVDPEELSPGVTVAAMRAAHAPAE